MRKANYDELLRRRKLYEDERTRLGFIAVEQSTRGSKPDSEKATGPAGVAGDEQGVSDSGPGE